MAKKFSSIQAVLCQTVLRTAQTTKESIIFLIPQEMTASAPFGVVPPLWPGPLVGPLWPGPLLTPLWPGPLLTTLGDVAGSKGKDNNGACYILKPK